MSALDLLTMFTVAIVAFCGLGMLVGVQRKRGGIWGYIEQVLVTVYVSLILASVTVFVLGELGLVGFGRGRAGVWGTYPVLAVPGDRAMVALALCVVFVAGLVVRSVFGIPIVRRFTAKALAGRRAIGQEIEIGLRPVSAGPRLPSPPWWIGGWNGVGVWLVTPLALATILATPSTIAPWWFGPSFAVFMSLSVIMAWALQLPRRPGRAATMRWNTIVGVWLVTVFAVASILTAPSIRATWWSGPSVALFLSFSLVLLWLARKVVMWLARTPKRRSDDREA